MNWVVEPLIPGDLIRVKRSFYYHFAIYIGNNEVIHFSGVNDDGITDPKNISVRIASVDMFSKNTLIEKAQYSLKEKLFKRPNDQILEIAKSRLGEQGYDFLRNNCEHFAYSCVFTKKMKTQIDDYRDKIKGLIK